MVHLFQKSKETVQNNPMKNTIHTKSPVHPQE